MTFMKKGIHVDPEALLSQRERRARQLAELHKEDPNLTFLSFKLNIPGSIKSNAVLELVFKEGLVRIQRELQGTESVDEHHGVTGPEAILKTSAHPQVVKKAMVALEESSPLTRLYDIDIHSAGKALAREELGLPPRKCLLCGKPAKYCGRARTHTLEELLQAVETLLMTEPAVQERLINDNEPKED